MEKNLCDPFVLSVGCKVDCKVLQVTKMEEGRKEAERGIRTSKNTLKKKPTLEKEVWHIRKVRKAMNAWFVFEGEACEKAKMVDLNVSGWLLAWMK